MTMFVVVLIVAKITDINHTIVYDFKSLLIRFSQDWIHILLLKKYYSHFSVVCQS